MSTMDRGRRPRNQSDEKQSTSHLIQQLAAQRQRRLDAAAVRPDSANAHHAAALPPDSDSEQSGDEAQQQHSTGASGTALLSAASRAGSSKPRRGRLVRRDHAASQQQQQEEEDGDVDVLAGMLQDFGLSSSTHSISSGSSRASAAPARQHAAAFAPATSSSNTAAAAAAAGQGSKPVQVVELSAASSDFGSNSTDEGTEEQAAAKSASEARASDDGDGSSSNDVTDEIEDASSSGSGRDSEDDDEQLSCVPRSRKPAAVQQAPRPAAAAASFSGEEDESNDDEHACTDKAARSGGGGTAAEGPAEQQASTGSAASAGAMLLEGGFCLDGRVASKLYPHQVEGVRWLWSLHRMRKGGILADDMGLGKTMQCAAFLAGALQRSRHGPTGTCSSSGSAAAGASSCISSGALRALIVAPKTLLSHWEKELRVCGLGPRAHCFYGSSEGERAAALRAVTGRGGALLTTYGMVLHNAGQLRSGLGATAHDLDEHEDEEDPFCLQPLPGRRILWDFLILDEGHKVKNARTQLAQRLRELRASCRIIISGTPVQNNLAELHALLDFAVPGLLGGPREFKAAFEKPIAARQDRSAGLRVRELGAAKAAELRRIVGPFMIRREKKEVFGSSGSSGSAADGGSSAVVAAAAACCSGSSAAAAGAGAAVSAAPGAMGAKHDLVVWLRLQPLQRHIYEAFLHSDAVKAALNSSRSSLAALTVLKKVCDHPALLSERATKLVLSASKRGQQGKARPCSKGSKQRRSSLDDFIVDDDDVDGCNADSGDSGGVDDVDSSNESDASCSSGHGSKAACSRAAVAASLDDAGFSEEFLSWAAAEGLEARLLDGIRTKGPEASCKALFVAQLLEALVCGGHRTLVFSQSRVMLDILQAAVVARGWSFCRIDGSMSSTEARQAQVERFQAEGSSIPVFLLTTQVGGLGLTLTAANRVVIVDPSWNPATDNQSVDRAYRIGQSRDVVVYRLVTCGTVEEKIYRKQVFKGGLSKAGMEEGVQLRYFTHQELHELFKWDPAALAVSETQQLLKQQHKASAALTSIAPHVAWLEARSLCAGTSEHGLLFSHQDPEGQHLQLDAKYLNPGQQRAGSAAAAAGGMRPGISGYGRGSRPVTGTGAAAGPSAAELSNMLSSLNIANSSSSGSRQATAGRVDSHGQQQQQQAGQEGQQEKLRRRESLQVEIQQLQYQLSRVTTDLATVGPRLPDGGSKLKARQLELQGALEAAQQLQQQLITGAGAGPRLPALADITNSEHCLDEQQQQQQQSSCQPLRMPALDLQPSSAGCSRSASAGPAAGSQQQHQQQQGWVSSAARGGSSRPHAGSAGAAGYSFPNSSQWPQHGQQWVPPPPPPRQLQQQQYPPPPPLPTHRQEQLLPPPPPPLQQQQQQAFRQGGSSNGQREHCEQQLSSSQAAGALALSGVQTLDGRVPTLAELKQRKHVLKKALQAGDQLKEQLRQQGQRLPDQKQAQWAAMYAEYKEVKAALLQAEQQQQQGQEVQRERGGSSSSSGRPQQQVETIDLT